VALVTYVQGRGGNQFPESPARKREYSYFKVVTRRRGMSWDVCHGTKIRDRYDKWRAPDISLQRSSARNQPTWRHVFAIWDAKHRKSNSRRITNPEYAYFGMFIRTLRVPRPRTRDGLSRVLPRAFEVSALITNGRFAREPEEHCLDCGFSMVESFIGDVNVSPQPSRRKHIQRNP
jgi:hypothetical protein